MPACMPQNRNANWPMNKVAAIAIMRRHGTRGRGNTAAGSAAMANRVAASIKGGKWPSASRAATKLSPHKADTKTAKAIWAGFMA